MKGRIYPYPFSAVPPQSSHRQLQHQPAGPPGRHRSLDHHGARHSLCGCLSLYVWGAVQPDSRVARGLSARALCLRRKVELGEAGAGEGERARLSRGSMCGSQFEFPSVSKRCPFCCSAQVRSTQLLVSWMSAWEPGRAAALCLPLSSRELPLPPSDSLPSAGGLTRSLD